MASSNDQRRELDDLFADLAHPNPRIQQEAYTAMVDDWPEDGYSLQCAWEPTNRGYGPGHNTVIRGLNSNYHLILNPDVELQPDSLQAGLAVLQSCHDIALISPWAAGGSGEQEFLCKGYPSVLVLVLRLVCVLVHVHAQV